MGADSSSGVEKPLSSVFWMKQEMCLSVTVRPAGRLGPLSVRLDVRSGHDLVTRGIEPRVGLCADACFFSNKRNRKGS